MWDREFLLNKLVRGGSGRNRWLIVADPRRNVPHLLSTMNVMCFVGQTMNTVVRRSQILSLNSSMSFEMTEPGRVGFSGQRALSSSIKRHFVALQKPKDRAGCFLIGGYTQDTAFVLKTE